MNDIFWEQVCQLTSTRAAPTCVTEIVDVWSHPAPVGQLLQVVGGLVVAADENGQHGSNLLAGVVLEIGTLRSVNDSAKL